MLRLNVIMLLDASGEKLLMCRRRKDPYKGLYNFTGGKVRDGEDSLHAAYRELREETGVTAADVTLHHLANFTYISGGAGLPPYELQAYVGRLSREIDVTGEENPLLWMPLTENFFDITRFAGEGSVGHILESVRRYRPGWMEAQPPQITLAPLAEADLPVLAYYHCCTAEDLLPMLEESRAQCHEGRYYEQFAVQMNGCLVGGVSLYAHDAETVCNGVEIFPPFRQCGFAARALTLLSDIARERGYTVQTAQVRTNNTASIALHRSLGMTAGEPWINRNGNEVVTFRKTL